MMWEYIVFSLIGLFFYIKSKLLRNIVNFVIIWSLKIVGWIIGRLIWVFERIDGKKQDIKVVTSDAKAKSRKSGNYKNDIEKDKLLQQILQNPDISISIKDN